jgi:hypothetical protein
MPTGCDEAPPRSEHRMTASPERADRSTRTAEEVRLIIRLIRTKQAHCLAQAFTYDQVYTTDDEMEEGRRRARLIEAQASILDELARELEAAFAGGGDERRDGAGGRGGVRAVLLTEFSGWKDARVLQSFDPDRAREAADAFDDSHRLAVEVGLAQCAIAFVTIPLMPAERARHGVADVRHALIVEDQGRLSVSIHGDEAELEAAMDALREEQGGLAGPEDAVWCSQEVVVPRG